MKKRILSLVLCAAMLLSMCLFLGAGVMDDTTADGSAESTESYIPAVNFTNVAPFGPAVTGASPLRARSVTTLGLDGNTTDSDNDGLVMSKTAKDNGNDTYTITLEAYTTGTVTTEKEDVPTDIVLVLDQSGSMADCIVCGKEIGRNSTHTVYTYTAAYNPDTRYNYYIIVDGDYKEVQYGDIGDFWGSDYAWYYTTGPWLDQKTHRVSPKTSENDPDPSHVQFYTRTGTKEACTSRLSALKKALNTFTEAVKTKAAGADSVPGTGDDVNHRIAMVGFASSDKNYNRDRYENTELLIGSKQYGYTSASKYYANAFQDMRTTKGQNNVVASINALDAYGGTFTNLGVEMANGIFNANQVQSGEQRNRVMVVFTDGLPGTGNYNSSVANSAISQAQTAKNSGVTVYSVGIFSGADATSAGNQNGSETEKANYFMQNVSSNNGTPQNPSYYLSAGDSDSLNSIFKQISNQISNPSINLGSETVVKDVVTPYFDMPANTSDIKVYTQDATAANGTEWAVREQSPLKPTINDSDSSISVTGFDFNANFVSDKEKPDGTYGKKLIIEFTVKPKAGFLGGNDVFTNDNAAIYDKSTATEPVRTFDDKPQVNVRIKGVTVTATDKNVYLLGSLTADELKAGATVKVGDVTLDLTKANDTDRPYGLDKWQTDYVDITVTIKDKDGNEIPAMSELRDDVSYTIEATVAPKKESPSSQEGDPAVAQTGVATANVNVFKPELTYKDSEVYYGDTAPSDFTENRTVTAWKRGDVTADIATMGPAPTLTLAYTPDANAIDENGKVNTRQDFGVGVTVKIDGNDVTGDTSFLHTKCDGKDCNLQNGQQFLFHVKTCSLTINKTVTGGGDSDQTFVFNVKDKDDKVVTTIVLKNGKQKTITGLAVGDYTVVEDTGWSWSYTAVSGNNTKVTLSSARDSDTVGVTNKYNKPNWLTSIADVINKWLSAGEVQQLPGKN